MAEETQYDVFLSHNSADQPAVKELARRLADEAGLQPFLDEWHIIPGEPWQEAVEEALDASRSCAVFLGPEGMGTWENEQMRAALDIRVSRPGYRVIPVLLPGSRLPERGRLPRFLARHTWVDFRPGLDDADAFHRLVCGIQGVAPRPERVTEAEAVCPFRGLQVFDEEHACFFFGREALTQHLVEQLREDRFLAVIGPSGSGKSSLVRAGLVPQIRQGALPASNHWPILLFKPGADPLGALAAQLIPSSVGADKWLAVHQSLLEHTQQDERGLHRMVQVMLASRPDNLRLLVIVDQLEELFTLCRGESARASFIANLLYASAIAGGQTVVVVTMRSDFFGKCAAYPDLAARLAERDVLVGPMSENELRRAMEGPAQVVSLHYEKGLVETILGDLGDEPGTLPLLQHTLLELWERRRGGWLTADAYHKIGGVKGALAQRADKIYARLTPEQQAAARRVLLRLTQPGEGTEDTRRRATLAELLPAGRGAAAVVAAVRKLADARLLTTSKDERGDEIVDVAHEALIRGWPHLRRWINEDRAILLTHRRLTETANEWDKHGRDESYLYRGAKLTEVEQSIPAGDLSALEKEFVQASVNARKAEHRAHRRRIALRVVTVGLALLFLVSIGALIRQIRSSRPLWQPVVGFPDDPVMSLAVTDESPPTYYVGTTSIGVGRSNDGVNWTLYRQGLPTGGDDPWKNVRGVGLLAIDRLNPDRVFAAVVENGICRSEDKAETWEAANIGLPVGPDEDAVDLAAHGDLVLAVFNLYAGRTLYASLDSGTTWELVGGGGAPPLDKAYAVEIAPGDKVYVGAENGLYSSAIGPPWEWKPLLSLAPVAIITPGAGDNNGFYLATRNPQGTGDIYRWQPGETEQWLATVGSYPIALAPPADPNAAVAVYVLLLNGKVQAVKGDGQISPLGQEPGLVFDLLAVSHAASEGTRLLLGHRKGLLEYQDDLDQLESR